MYTKGLRSAATLLCLCVLAPPGTAQELLLGALSAEHEVARALCRVIDRQAPGTRCSALVTPDPEFNLSNVSGGALELAVVPSDLHHHAVHGTGPFAFTDIPYDNLRSLFSLHARAFTVVARRDAGIRELAELEGRRVNIGSPDSAERALMERVMAAMGWGIGDFKLAEQLAAGEQSLALCHDRVQAGAYLVAHPDEEVSQTVELCDARLVEVAGAGIDALVAERPYYVYTTIPGGLYPQHPEAVRTFALRATLVSSSDVGAEHVYRVVAAVLGNLERLRRMHPALARLAPETMMHEGLAAPLHEGALRYYRERGWK